MLCALSKELTGTEDNHLLSTIHLAATSLNVIYTSSYGTVVIALLGGNLPAREVLLTHTLPKKAISSATRRYMRELRTLSTTRDSWSTPTRRFNQMQVELAVTKS